jgi:hypothetical protein
MKVTKPSLESRGAEHSGNFDLGRLGQQILNLLDASGARAAARRELLGLDRRELDDCGMTLADVDVGLPDMYAADFRVAHIAERWAA